jgi:hypothetical protein
MDYHTGTADTWFLFFYMKNQKTMCCRARAVKSKQQILKKKRIEGALEPQARS